MTEKTCVRWLLLADHSVVDHFNDLQDARDVALMWNLAYPCEPWFVVVHNTSVHS